jgi:seryl-tRNA synthetase
MSAGSFEPVLRTLEERSFPMVGGGEDPTRLLGEQGEVVQEGPGFFILGPLLTRVVDRLEQRMLDVAGDMGASPYRFPAMISPSYLEKVQYFRNFPHSLSFATHLRENLPDIQNFADHAVTEQGKIVVDREVYAPVKAMLAPTVCHHLYLALSGSRLPPEGVIATANGHCFRFESRNMVSLERLWNFTMREIIFVGAEVQVRERLDEVRDRLRPVLDEFEISYKLMTANDPFFIGTFRDQAAYQAAFELKYEIRAALPYKGDTLAIGSYNRHGSFFGRSLDIQLADGAPAHTGCIGIGFERFVHAFVSQHGIDPAKWPRAVQEVAFRGASEEGQTSRVWRGKDGSHGNCC